MVNFCNMLLGHLKSNEKAIYRNPLCLRFSR
jgi:uncharacterized Tic20 family protein